MIEGQTRELSPRQFGKHLLLAFLLTFAPAVLFAQDVVDAPPGLEQTLNEMEKKGKALEEQAIQEFKADSNFDVSTNQNGDTVIKKRTPRSPKVLDPEAVKNIQNLQRMFNGGFGIGAKASGRGSYEPYASSLPGKVLTDGVAPTVFFEGGIRPPFGFMKRLFIGAGISLGGKNTKFYDGKEEQVHYLSFTADQKAPHWYSAEWDVLVIPGKKSASALSGGYFRGTEYIDNQDIRNNEPSIEVAQRTQGAMVRWRGIFASIDDGAGVGWHFVTRVSTQGTVTMYVGLNIMFGPRMWIKKKADK